MGTANVKPNKSQCTFRNCTVTPKMHLPANHPGGNNIGNGPALAKSILTQKYSKYNIKINSHHPLSEIGGDPCEAHHLICSESMKKGGWSRICQILGYDINDYKNGVMLPASMKVACELGIPLHKGNHGATLTTVNKNYVRAVKAKIKPMKDAANNAKFCKNPQDFKDQMDSISREIWNFVVTFLWTLTYDGKDYMPGRLKGCCGAISIGSKRDKITRKILRIGKKEREKKNSGIVCPNNRIHFVERPVGPFFLERNVYRIK